MVLAMNHTPVAIHSVSREKSISIEEEGFIMNSILKAVTLLAL